MNVNTLEPGILEQGGICLLAHSNDTYLLDSENHPVYARLHGSVWRKKADLGGITFELVAPVSSPISPSDDLNCRIEKFLDEEECLSEELGELVQRVTDIINLANEDGVSPSLPRSVPSPAQESLNPKDEAAGETPSFAIGASVSTSIEAALKFADELSSAAPASANPQAAQRIPEQDPHANSPLYRFLNSGHENAFLGVGNVGESNMPAAYFKVKAEDGGAYSMRYIEMKEISGPPQYYKTLDELITLFEKSTGGDYRIISARKLYASLKTARRVMGSIMTKAEHPTVEALSEQIADLTHKFEFEMIPGLTEEKFKAQLQDLMKKRDTARKTLSRDKAAAKYPAGPRNFSFDVGQDKWTPETPLEDVKRALHQMFGGVASDLGTDDISSEEFNEYAAMRMHDSGMPLELIDELKAWLSKGGNDWSMHLERQS